MVMGYKSIVVILDVSASRDIRWDAIAEALQRLPLNPGDKVTFLGVLHLVSNPLGYKSKVNSNIINPRTVDEELARKQELFYEHLELLKQNSFDKIQLEFELRAGPSRKEVAVEAAKSLGATWIILDREMKKDRKYFLKNLSCRISKMKSDNNIEELRGPIEMVLLENEIMSPSNCKNPSTDINDQVSYDEMIPGDSWEEHYNSSQKRSEGIRKSPIGKASNDSANHLSSREDVSGKSCSETKDPTASTCKFSKTKNSQKASLKQETSFATLEATGAKASSMTTSSSGTDMLISGDRSQQRQQITEEALGNLVCSVCENRRQRIAWHKDFTYAEVYEATGGFCDENFISEGGFGYVFKGKLKNGLKIAVKQHKKASLQGEKEFKSEVDVLSKARHENLVMLLGSCSEGSHRLLVYEYVCNSSLDRHLSKNAPKPLTWEKRINIALGAAKGLEYLHGRNIIHRDMRPNNILITHDHEALLGDFGLAKEQLHHDSSEDNIVGTLGYMAPEYAQTGKVSTKTDVYSFGVVLLQLVTGLSTTDKMPHDKSLVGWAKPLLKEKNYPDLIDRRIIDSHDFLQLFWMVQLTEKCLSTDPTKRFTMQKVVDTLQSIKNGDTTCIGDFSPISDSMISILDSFEAEEEEEEEEDAKSK